MRYILVVLLACISLQCSSEKSFEAVDYVSTLVGSQSKHSLSTGNTYPAIARPWGMNFWTPQTGTMGNGWTYDYTADKIRGFKQTHQPSPWMNDYGQFAVMPVTGDPVFDEDSRASWFSHKAEEARPYYYSVYLADHDVFTELTTTSRAAIMRLKYPERELSYFVLDALDNGSYVEIIPSDNMIVGYSTKNTGGVAEGFKNWFVLVCNTPFEYMTTITDGESFSQDLKSDSSHSGAIVGYKTSRGQKVEWRIASSFISLEQAKLNLQEVQGLEFDTVKAEARDEWNTYLSRIEVSGGNVDEIRTFYSCLYRSLLFPRDLSEINESGQRVHCSPYNGEIREGYLFADTGFWDTFRSLFPLLNLVYPDTNEKIQQGLVNAYLESGLLPEWSSPGHRPCMVGNNSASVVADAYLHGLEGYDIDKLWEAVLHGANTVHPTISSSGRYGWEYYNKLGYIPCDVGINESAARTLEYAYNDWCIYSLGKALGKDGIDIYKQRAYNYRNLFRSDFNLMSGRKADGSFPEDFNPLKWGGDFTEGNALHYTWSVFHDVAGLIDLMGGDAAFNEQLDNVFEIAPDFDDSYYGFTIHEIREMQIMNMGNYAHGNQPIQHMIYLYNWSGEPWKAQKRVREVMSRFYTAAPDGYCGDEDNGQTSAWYVFSAMGFYPVCPCSNELVLGSPLFDKVVVRRPDGVNFTINARDNSGENVYVDGLKLNGRKWDRNYVLISDLKSGAKLDFNMSSVPNLARGTSHYACPSSLSTSAE